MEAQVCGGGNSAGQAVIFLAQTARKVLLLIRGDLGRMSDYLVQRAVQTANIRLLTEITAMNGNERLKEIELTNRRSNKTRRVRVAGVFSFIGVSPRTIWLPAEIELNEKGFVSTGALVAGFSRWTRKHSPFYLETSRSISR